MATKLEIRSPQMRCYRCGWNELTAVCHHCGQGMCHKHLPSVAKPNSAEFTGLGLDKVSAPFHCRDCDHVVRHRLTPFAIGASVAAFGGFFMFTNVVLGLLVGAVVVGGCLWLNKKRLDEAIRSRPPVPVVPTVSSLLVKETVRGELQLDRDGTYRSSVVPVEGKVTVDMAIGRLDVERIDLYRKKFRLPDTEELRFCAGFVVLEGRIGLRFLDAPERRAMLDLTYDVQGHPLFMPASVRGSGEWTLDLDYRLRSGDEVESIPIWLTPSFVREQDQRAVELELQWTEFSPENGKLEIDRIESLCVLVPLSWGNLESMWPDATVGVVNDPDDPDEFVRRIMFTALSVKDRPENGGVCFSMRFENEIKPTDVIRGDFVVSFKGALSGVTKVSVFHPLGKKQQLKVKKDNVWTEVAANYRLCLDGIRYQDLRMVPDHSEADRSRRENVAFKHVIPDHETVIDLTNELSAQGYYVKRVIENPPRAGASADVVNRIWDIAGRRYDGVYPVDFHLVLTGEEFHEGDIRAHGGNTMVQITAQGAYTRPVDSADNGSAGLEDKIVRTWEHLREATVATLDRRAARAVEEPHHHRPAPRRATAVTDENSVPPRRPGQDTARVARLRKQLDDATEAVIRGDMTESTFQSIQSSIQRELGKLYEE